MFQLLQQDKGTASGFLLRLIVAFSATRSIHRNLIAISFPEHNLRNAIGRMTKCRTISAPIPVSIPAWVA